MRPSWPPSGRNATYPAVQISRASSDFVSIRIQRDTEASALVRILIEDSGGGVPADIIANVFQPFFTTRTGLGGTGLGLAICRATVESLKGTIDVSNAEHGACFVVSLPIHVAVVASPLGL